LMTTWWEHHNVFLLAPYFFALRAVMVEPMRARVAAGLLVLSVAWVGLARHPLVWDWAITGPPKWKALRDGMMESKRFGILLLLIDNQSTRLHAIESQLEINLRALLVKDKSGASWLDYDIWRKDATAGNLDVAGAVAVPTSGPVVVGEFAGAHGTISVRVEIV